MKLDCENFETAIGSICGLFQADKESILALLRSIDVEETYSRQELDYLGHEFLFRFVVDELGSPQHLDRVCWFHLTRTLPDTNFFETGILPLKQAVEIIWKSLLRLFKGTERYERLLDLQGGDFEWSNGQYYKKKISAAVHRGPFAVLVRDAAFNSAAIGTHDYLKCPEIVEDICKGYRDEYGECILTEVVEHLRPCIVKFISRRDTSESCVKRALSYVYLTSTKRPFSTLAHTNFDAGGNAIPKEDILDVNWP